VAHHGRTTSSSLPRRDSISPSSSILYQLNMEFHPTIAEVASSFEDPHVLSLLPSLDHFFQINSCGCKSEVFALTQTSHYYPLWYFPRWFRRPDASLITYIPGIFASSLGGTPQHSYILVRRFRLLRVMRLLTSTPSIDHQEHESACLIPLGLRPSDNYETSRQRIFESF